MDVSAIHFILVYVQMTSDSLINHFNENTTFHIIFVGWLNDLIYTVR